MADESITENDSNPPTVVSTSRWPGVALSFCVQGFGLYRAGCVKRAAFWFIGISLFQVTTALTLAAANIPIIVGMTLVLILCILEIIMLCDSFRPGKMTGRKWLVFISCFVILAVVAPFRTIVKPFTIPTRGMQPALSPEDRFIVSRLVYLLKPIKRGDIVAFRTNDIPVRSYNGIYVERVAAFAGEQVQIYNGCLFVNGRKMDFNDGLPNLDYTLLPSSDPTLDSRLNPYTVPEGTVFVLGDNLTHSADSRLYGGVPLKNIIGQAIKIYYPFSRMGPIK